MKGIGDEMKGIDENDRMKLYKIKGDIDKER